LNEADKNLDDLEKCCGLCVPAWKKSKKPRTNGAFKQRPLQTEVNQPTSRAAVVPSSHGRMGAQQNECPPIGERQYITRITNDAREDEMEQNLHQVEGMVGDLHTMATDMNQEIRTHNEILDRIEKKTDANQAQLNAAQKRAERIAGEPAKKSDGMESKAQAGIAAAKLMMQ
jgi:synaptosomal-associated protein 25